MYIFALRALVGIGGVGGGSVGVFGHLEIGEICVSFRGLSDKLRS